MSNRGISILKYMYSTCSIMMSVICFISLPVKRTEALPFRTCVMFRCSPEGVRVGIEKRMRHTKSKASSHL